MHSALRKSPSPSNSRMDPNIPDVGHPAALRVSHCIRAISPAPNRERLNTFGVLVPVARGDELLKAQALEVVREVMEEVGGRGDRRNCSTQPCHGEVSGVVAQLVLDVGKLGVELVGSFAAWLFGKFSFRDMGLLPHQARQQPKPDISPFSLPLQRSRPLARSAAVFYKPFVFSSLPIRKGLVLPLTEAQKVKIFSFFFSKARGTLSV